MAIVGMKAVMSRFASCLSLNELLPELTIVCCDPARSIYYYRA